MILNGRIYLKIPYEQRDKARSIEGRMWDKKTKCWTFPLSQIENVCTLFPGLTAAIKQVAKSIKKTPDTKTLNEKVPDKYLEEYYKSLPKRCYRPFDHQKQMIKLALSHRQFAFFCEMGTGKTKAAIDTAGILNYNGLVDRVLIMCPKTLLEVWVEEIKKNSNKDSIIISGTKKQRYNSLTKKSFYVIINYESFLYTLETDEWRRFDMTILDESTRIKSPKAGITKAVIKTFPHVKYKLILTGTPITQSPIDIYCQYDFLNPSFLNSRSFYAFRNTYCIMGGYMNYQITGYKRLPELKSKISKHSIQLKKEDCLDLPPKIYEKRYIEMNKEMEKQYKEMKKQYIIEYNDEYVTASIALVKLLRMQEILSGQYLKDQRNNNKLIVLTEILNEIIGENQVVLWCRFRPSIFMLRQLASKMKVPYSCIFGDIIDRKKQIDDFQSGHTKLFIGQIQTGGMGITLTAGTHVIVYENTFSLQDRKQFEDRVHRPGQTKKITYIDLIYKNTIDEKVLTAISNKQDVSNYLVECFNKGEY